MRKAVAIVFVLLTALPLEAQDKPAPGETFAIDNPIEPRLKLVLEDAYRPGTMVSLDQYKGKVVLLRAIACE